MFQFYKKRYGIKHTPVVFLLSGWKSNQSQYWLFSQLLAGAGYYCITYTYDDEILSVDPDMTVRNVSVVVQDLLQEVAELQKQGRKDICFFGTSLGTVPTILAANATKDVRKIILNTSGADIAKIVWSWDKELLGFKKSLLEHGISLTSLQKSWRTITPLAHVDNFQNKKVLFLVAGKDKIIPSAESAELQALLLKKSARVKVKRAQNLGHFLYGAANLFRAASLVGELLNLA